MRLTAIISFAITAALFAVCAAWPAWSVAEPISQDQLAPPPAAPAMTAQQMPEVTDAVAKFRQRDFDGALKSLKEAAKKNPDLPPGWVIMAQLFLQTNMGPAARNALERAVVELPNDPEAYTIMGELAIRERRIAEARLLYEKASGLMSGFNGGAKRKAALQPVVFSGLARTDELREDWTGAQKELEAWLKLEPKNTGALQQLARCLFQQKKIEGTLEKLKEAVKIEPTILTPEAIVAQLYHEARDEKNAQKWMIAALTAAPRDINTRLAAAEWAWATSQLDETKKTNQLEEAKKQAAAALQLDAKSLRAKFLSGLIALFQKDYQAAELYFESAFLQSPKEYGASNNLALALIEQKDEAKRDRALQYAEQNVRQYPKWPDGYSTYGWVLYKLGRLDDAEKALSQSISASGGTVGPETEYYLARILADVGKRDNDAKRLANAKRFLEDALKTTAPFAQRSDAKELLQDLGKADKAAEKPAEKPVEKPAEQPGK